MSSFGNENQQAYATDLARRLGFPSLEDALAKMSGRPAFRLDVTPVPRQEASNYISKMEAELNIAPRPRKSQPASSIESDPKADKARPRFLTARHLRLIATHKEQPPAELDDDARWVLAALARLQSMEFIFSRGNLTMSLAVNGDGPIRVSQVVQFFGSDATAAAAFGVSEKTLTGWGDLVPHAHQWRAEVLTQGYVMVPRDADGNARA